MRSLLFVLACCLASGELLAQESFLPSLQPRPELPAFKAPPTEGGFALPPVPDTTAAPVSGGVLLPVRQIVFRGNTVVSSAALAELARPYEGRSLNAAEIETLRQKLSRYYVDRGYLNSGATLGPNALVDGVLTFTLVEGRLSALRMKGLGRLNEQYVRARLVPDEDAVLNVETLRERFQYLLADPLFSRAQARVVPDSVPGRAILDVEFERSRPYQLSVFANNARAASIGEVALGLTGWVRNLSGWGDQLDLTWQTGFDGGGERKSVGWRIPLGARGTEFSLQYDTGDSIVLEAPTASLDIRSRLQSTDVGLSQRIYDSLSQRLSIGLNHIQRVNRSSILGVPFSFIPGEPNGVTRIDGWRFWQEYSHRWEDQALVLRSTFIDNQTNFDSVAGAPDKNNRIWLGQGHFARKLTEQGLQLSLRTTVQRSGNHLSPLDRVALGGVQSVRGFRENQLIRDQGSVFNVDLDYPVRQGGKHDLTLTLGVFHDRGSGKNHGEPSASLSSSGVTLKGQWDGWRFDLALALARRFPDGVQRRSSSFQDQGLHFQVSYAFFD